MQFTLTCRDEDGTITRKKFEGVYLDDVVSKTQDLEPVIMGNGAFFIFTKKEFIKNKNRTSENNYFYPINFPESVEIDTLDDFKLAEMYELS